MKDAQSRWMPVADDGSPPGDFGDDWAGWEAFAEAQAGIRALAASAGQVVRMAAFDPVRWGARRRAVPLSQPVQMALF